MPSGNDLLRMLRARLDDEGDDSMDAGGNAAPVDFWGNTELLLYLNMGQQEIFMPLVDLGKLNELKNLATSTTSGTAPAGFYAPYAAEITQSAVVEHATIMDNPMNGAKLYTAREAVVTVLGNAISANVGSAFTVYYWQPPTDIAANNTALTQMSTAFYDTVLDYAEYAATHKDLALSRIVMRRKFGETSLPFVQLQEYLGSVS